MTQFSQAVPPIATQAEMEAGVLAAKRTVSPLLVAQAIAALHQRQHMVLENQIFADRPDRHEIGNKGIQIEQRHPEHPRGG